MKQADRSLTPNERATLEFLLTDQIPDIATLRTQASTARVTGTCDCGCATINLRAAGDAPVWRPRVPVERIAASAFSRSGVKPALLQLHVIDGRIAELEIVDVDGSGPQAEFPPVSSWQAPMVGPGPDSYRWPDND